MILVYKLLLRDIMRSTVANDAFHSTLFKSHHRETELDIAENEEVAIIGEGIYTEMLERKMQLFLRLKSKLVHQIGTP